jgi:hypothetical protein
LATPERVGPLIGSGPLPSISDADGLLLPAGAALLLVALAGGSLVLLLARAGGLRGS